MQIEWVHQKEDTDAFLKKKKKTQLYAVYKKLTPDLRIYKGSSEGDR